MQAISVAELYGILDPDTRDWTDGLLSNIFREINKPLLPGKVWNSLSTCCLSFTLLAVECQQSSCLLVGRRSYWSSLNCVLVQDEAKYVIFDGDVDAVWVENMNSVMDDNRLLTLPNGERIRLQPHCRMLFEVCSSFVCIQNAGFLQHLLAIQVNQPPVGVLHLTTQSAHRRVPCCAGWRPAVCITSHDFTLRHGVC